VPDVVAFGEAMVRLAPPHFQHLEQARTLDVEVGGAELNAAAGLVRLGRSAEWVSRLPDNPLGRLVRNRVREAGVGDRHVKYADGRCGLYFLEFGAAPRPSGLVYDRKDSALSRIAAGEFDWPAVFAGARWFHVTGITPALGPGPAAVTAEALAAAKAAGLTVSIDLNYRSALWTEAEAGRVMGELLTHCDVLIAGEADAEHLFGVTGGSFADVAQKLTDRFGLTAVAGVKRETPLVWRNRFGAVGYSGGKFYESPWYEVEIVDRLGAGDALASGLIHGMLDGDFEAGLAFGAAMGAVKHSVPGDLPWIDKAEVEAVMAGGGLRIKR
jgi:2-dehydro-3-deoxygluconokinase